MQYARDEERGLLAIALDDDSTNVLRFGRMRYDGKLRLFRSDCCLCFSEFVSYATKLEAVAAARRLRFPAAHVERIGSRLWSAWGIRHDHRDSYFLAVFE